MKAVNAGVLNILNIGVVMLTICTRFHIFYNDKVQNPRCNKCSTVL